MPTYIRDAGAWKAVSGGSSTVNDVGSADQVLYKNSSNVATTSSNFTFDGNSVGIGIASPTERLHVQGNIRVTGSLISSDIDLKKNIQTIPNALDKVLQLRGVEFDWKDTNEHQIGVIAQEVEKIIPDVVVGENGDKAVAYQNLVAVLIEAIKELAEKVEKLENK